ncbi:hypothetical protein SARC_15623 [Sphaeroforma arctica JP610]|uniref:CBS domain-containing protein n=1 Tax=Sphaeroforma arctica JP610 TaxID=667725 RepID=A0A0L0F5E9_9EUKA|nr:hypothetical protein SARC_15623 [Sphaeroforma arctica JP610]KNC71834.1 hypothetical protein SARC_15623 [Sphaeroforma arctica JP610]|eukprot:XP_014145736.1 hypothetical protein SARC_15623 [Sphaeroforma arctica JP610]
MNKIREIYSMGHSRIPVYRDNIQDITGCMMIKDLSLLDPDDATPLSQVELKPLQQVSEKYALFSMMNDFLTGECML